MKYTILGIMMHRKCNARCKICSVSCSPTAKEKLDIERIKKMITSCKGTTIVNVAFTGGEPFLEYNDLCDLVSHTAKEDLSPSVVTNGFWAESYDKALEMLARLKELGLERINVSFDKYHEEYVSIDNINNIILACDNLDLPYVVSAAKIKGEKIGDLIDKFDERIISLKLMINPCQPVGNAKENFDESDFIKPIENSNLKCPYGGIITVHFDGRIFPCCAHQVFDSRLSIGSYKDMDIPEVLRRVKNNGLLYVLRNYGLNPFKEFIDQTVYADENYISSPCEVCSELFSGEIKSKLSIVKEILTEHNIQYEKV